MPYIVEDDRKPYKFYLDWLVTLLSKSGWITGHLTYAIYYLCLAKFKAKPCYQTGAEVVAALETAKLEFYRRELAGYEDKKIQENGDL